MKGMSSRDTYLEPGLVCLLPVKLCQLKILMHRMPLPILKHREPRAKAENRNYQKLVLAQTPLLLPSTATSHLSR